MVVATQQKLNLLRGGILQIIYCNGLSGCQESELAWNKLLERVNVSPHVSIKIALVAFLTM
jgi:hypothetical protein